MRTFPTLSRELMDLWFDRLLRNPGSDFREQKRRVRDEIRTSYLEYLRILADRRSRLIAAKAQVLGPLARANAVVADSEAATIEFDSNIHNFLVLAKMVYSTCQLVGPAVSLGAAVARGVNNKVLIRESMKYWPSVTQFRAVWREVDKEAVRRAATKLAMEVGKDAAMEPLLRLINHRTHAFDPTFWARRMMATTPEQEFAERRHQLERLRGDAEEAVDRQIAALDSRIARARDEMNELLEYVDACVAGS